MEHPWYTYIPDYTWMKSKNGSGKTYNLDNPVERREYYQEKVGKEIEYIKGYLHEQSFLAYWMAPKQAGKGTYMNAMKEIFGIDAFTHVSVGDLVRAADKDYQEKGKMSEYYAYAKVHYRGDLELDEAFEALAGRSTKTLVPTELVLAFLRLTIERSGKKSLFIDGFPRNLDQVSYSLYFRELINYRSDPDFFILINAPITVLDERIKKRRTCLKCGNSRNLILLPTDKYGYDKEKDEYYLICDLPGCDGGRMVEKEGDHLGMEPLKDRVMADIEVLKRARKLYGIPKIELYNSLESEVTLDYVDEYELTPSCHFTHDAEGNAQIHKDIWEISEDGKKFRSLLPPAVAIQLVKQLARNLGMKEE